MFSPLTFKNSIMHNNEATKSTKGLFAGFSDIIIKDSYFANKELTKSSDLDKELSTSELTGGLLCFTIGTKAYLEKV